MSESKDNNKGGIDKSDLTEDQKYALLIIDRQTLRTRCLDISPAVAKIAKLRQVKRDVRLSHLHNILSKCAYAKKTIDPSQYPNPNTFYTIPSNEVSRHMKHITDFDKSVSIIPHGEVSKRYK